MSLRNHLVLCVALASLAALAACGSGSGAVNPNPPPNGSFGDSNLNGTYVFTASGVDTDSDPYAMVGTFTANGTGGISGGTVDINDPGFSTELVPNSTFSSGSYTIGVDGRGRITLSTSTPFGSIVLDCVLQDSSHGLVTQFDNNAAGSGTIDAQTAGVTPAGTYAFEFSGADLGTGATYATVGNFTISSGSIAGLEDFSDGGFAYPNQSLAGTVVLGPSSTPGTTLATSFRSTVYDVFAIDASHLKFIEMDTAGSLVGDAYSQTSASIPAETLAFTLSGSYPSGDTNSAAGGFIVTDGNGNVTSSSTADANNNGSVTSAPVSFSGTYTAAGTGRYTLALNSFTDGTGYVAYPSSGGLFLLEIDNDGTMSGAGYVQSSMTFGALGYALNLSGVNTTDGVAVGDIAEFTATSSGTLSGAIDENFDPGGTPNYGMALSGSYSAPDSNGRGQLGATAGTSSNTTLNGGFDLTFYSVDGTSFPFIETDANGQISSGIFVAQNAGSSAASAAKTHLFVPQAVVRSRAALKKKK
ncbi:MAG TPA: hypothetical protein VMD76_01920 [Candidatus Sulfotelmatobacter sp.]|nr:hypothetical protein [Candidatus Sulfotelmatobacter sp.]